MLWRTARKNGGTNGDQRCRAWRWCAFILFAVVSIHLFATHYVQDYSDPVQFMNLSAAWAAGDGTSDRAPVYPVILYGLTAIMGRDGVFISNIPFLVLMLALLARMTFRLRDQDAEDPNDQTYAWMASLAAVWWLVYANTDILRQLINPFREPLTFVGMLLSVLLLLTGWQRKSKLMVLASGIALGFSSSIRETTLLMGFPVGLWILSEVAAERRVRWLLLLSLAGGIILGLMPLLYKNYAYSGQALVPAYSAGRVQTYGETGRWDIPVPGMRVRYFHRTGPVVVKHFVETYSWWGWLFAVIGIYAAIRKKNRELLFIVLPSFLIFVLFYSFYMRFMRRYVLVADLFVVIMMAYGFSHAVRWGAEYLQNKRPLINATGWMPRLILGGLIIWPAVYLFPPVFRNDGRLKVWHLSTLREELSAPIEAPAVFMGHHHFARRMRWLVNQTSYEYTRRFDRDIKVYASLEERLRTHGKDTVKRFADGKYYIDESDFSLARHWLERIPVFDFGDLSVPFERYGRPIEGRLYRVRLWQQKKNTLVSDRPRPRKAMLMLDLGRPWDYPGRHHLTGAEVGSDRTYGLTNGVQFIELDDIKIGMPFEFRLTSNRPLPPNPFWRLIEINQAYTIAYGMAASHWAWNLVSDTLPSSQGVPRDSVRLYDKATVTLPVFATQDHDVYATFRVEFFQEHPYWQSQRHRLTAMSRADAVSVAMPTRHDMGHVAVFLGNGSDCLDWVTIDLETTLPAYATQTSPAFSAKRIRHGFAKIHDVRISSFPQIATFPVRLNIGDAGDERYILSGFYPRERSGHHTVRWSKPEAALRVRLPSIDAPMAVEWRVATIRPALETLQPRFAVNGREVSVNELEIRKQGEGLLIYRFIVPADQWQRDGWNTFTLNVTPFVPAAVFDVRDSRELGLFVESVTIDRLPSSAPLETGGLLF